MIYLPYVALFQKKQCKRELKLAQREDCPKQKDVYKPSVCRREGVPSENLGACWFHVHPRPLLSMQGLLSVPRWRERRSSRACAEQQLKIATLAEVSVEKDVFAGGAIYLFTSL